MDNKEHDLVEGYLRRKILALFLENLHTKEPLEPLYKKILYFFGNIMALYFIIMIPVAVFVTFRELISSGNITSVFIFIVLFFFLWIPLYYGYKHLVEWIIKSAINLFKTKKEKNKGIKHDILKEEDKKMSLLNPTKKEIEALERAEKQHQEDLQMLAEGRAAGNQLKAEAGFRDDSSPFNPRLSEEDAYWVIKKTVEANKKEEDDNKKRGKKIK